MMLRRTLGLIVLLLTGTAAAQDAEPEPVAEPATGTVVVRTNLPEGLVYADEQLLGPASAQPFVLTPGTYTLRLVDPNREAWRPRHAETLLTLTPDQTATVRLDVPTRYRIESVPFGATVTLVEGETERVLGETPLELMVEEPWAGTLVVSKPGYAPVREEAGQALDNRHTLILPPLEVEAGAEVAYHRPKRSKVWIDYAAAGVALAAAGVAVYYKFEADDRYDTYLKTGDPNLRPEIDRYDTYSTAALGVMQVGLGVLAIRFVLR